MKPSTKDSIKSFFRDVLLILVILTISVGTLLIVFSIIWKYNLFENII
jgi:hypothetical protein